MEILRRGSTAADAYHTVTCAHCSSLLRFQRKEAKLVEDQRDGDYYEIRCPVCGEPITIQAGLVESRKHLNLDSAGYHHDDDC